MGWLGGVKDRAFVVSAVVVVVVERNADWEEGGEGEENSERLIWEGG